MRNIELYHKEIESLDPLQRNVFLNLFVGALAALVDEETWKMALKSAHLGKAALL